MSGNLISRCLYNVSSSILNSYCVYREEWKKDGKKFFNYYTKRYFICRMSRRVRFNSQIVNIEWYYFNIQFICTARVCIKKNPFFLSSYKYSIYTKLHHNIHAVYTHIQFIINSIFLICFKNGFCDRAHVDTIKQQNLMLKCCVVMSVVLVGWLLVGWWYYCALYAPCAVALSSTRKSESDRANACMRIFLFMLLFFVVLNMSAIACFSSYTFWYIYMLGCMHTREEVKLFLKLWFSFDRRARVVCCLFAVV